MAPPKQTASFKKALPVALIVFAALLRIWAFPARDELRDTDETGYVTSGLVAWEGMPPTMRVVPAATQTWEGWFYTAARSTWEMVRLQREGGVPTVLKPFKAIDAALFKTYEDFGGLRLLMLWISVVISLLGVYGGYRLGARYGNATGGVLIGGLVAVLPIYVEYTGIAKSCSDAWMLGIMAVSCAATMEGARRRWVAGILLGLSVSCRIDSVVLIPLVLWMVWDNANSEGFWPSALRICVISFATTALSAPWVMLGFIGTLRTIGMARVVGYWASDSPRLATFKDLMWREGMGPVLLAAAAGFLVSPAATRRKRAVLAVVTAFLVATMFGSHYEPMRYHGGPLIALVAFAAIGVGSLLNRISASAITAAILVLLLALPMAQSVQTVRDWKSYYAPDAANEWIEQHISPGTIVYMHANFSTRAILPTEAAADNIWHLVAGDQAWRMKLEDGLRRFSLPKGDLPRAMSQDNLAMDQGGCRRWFILGGGKSQRPRYDIHLVSISTTVGWHIQDLAQDFKKTGGVVLWRTAYGQMPPQGLGEPTMSWLNQKGFGTFVYVSPDVREKMLAK